VTGLLTRVASFFVEPPPAAPSTQPLPEAAPVAGAASGAGQHAAAAVVGATGAVVPVAAACAGELRARQRAGAAVVCVWRPDRPPAARPSGGAAIPGARRLAARLTDAGLTATACGRLAWIALDPEPERAADELRRCWTVAGAPLVLAVAAARAPALEPLLVELHLVVAVLAPDADPALRELAETTLPGRTAVVLAPLAVGPPRWAAMAGLARLRSLPETIA